MPRRDDQFMLRLPDGWREAIKARAARNRRSMNQEILAALESVAGVTATGEQFADQTPVAAQNATALPGGSTITHG